MSIVMRLARFLQPGPSLMSEVSRHAEGKIAVVQEERFRLISDDGQGLLLTLSHSTGVTPEELRQFQREAVHLAVAYNGEPNMASGVARSVRKT